MKQTAVEKMIQYFIEQKNNGASYWCINDLLGQLHQAKAMEKEQIIESYCIGCAHIIKDNNIFPRETSEQYYNETFKSE